MTFKKYDRVNDSPLQLTIIEALRTGGELQRTALCVALQYDENRHSKMLSGSSNHFAVEGKGGEPGEEERTSFLKNQTYYISK